MYVKELKHNTDIDGSCIQKHNTAIDGSKTTVFQLKHNTPIDGREFQLKHTQLLMYVKLI